MKDRFLTIAGTEGHYHKYPIAIVINGEHATAENVYKAIYEEMTVQNYIRLFNIMEAVIRNIT